MIQLTPRRAIQFQKGLSLPEFQRLYGTEWQREAALEKARWPDRFRRCPRLSRPRAWAGLWPAAQALSVPYLRPSGHPPGWHDHAGHQTPAAHLVPGLLSDRPGQCRDLLVGHAWQAIFFRSPHLQAPSSEEELHTQLNPILIDDVARWSRGTIIAGQIEVAPGEIELRGVADGVAHTHLGIA